MTAAGQDPGINFGGICEFRNEVIENGATFFLAVPDDLCLGAKVLNWDLDGGIDFIDQIVVELVG